MIATDRRTSNALAFTLVELLVVIAVIAVLAAIIFPIFSAAQERGRRSACLSNMRQIGVAVAQYVADNDEVYPTGVSGDPEWIGQVYPYLKSTDVLKCPDDATPVQSGSFVDSYAMNGNLFGYSLFHRPLPFTSDTALTAPSSTALLFEVSNVTDDIRCVVSPFSYANSAFGNGTGQCRIDVAPGGYTPCASGAAPIAIFGNTSGYALYATGNMGGRTLNGDYVFVPRHSGGSNYVACDGHAKWLHPQDISAGFWAYSPDCDQQPSSTEPPDCQDHPTVPIAAGTAFPGYQMTFSTR
jgi:prepilin-type N-terminal cleavage/methylation domain-containing protein/prepilin-type processing-associated H-X9-DG protein